MDKLNRMLKSFFWFAILPPIIMLLLVLYFHGTTHMFGFITFVLVCIASACANAYRSRKKLIDYPTLILRFKNNLKGNFMTV